MSRSSIRRRNRAPLSQHIACKNHPEIEAEDKEKRLCHNCLAYEAQGKSLADRAAGVRPPPPPEPQHQSAARPPKILR